MNNEQKIIDEELIKLLQGGNAHNDLTDVLKGLPIDARGIKPDKLPYSIWQLLEHIRIAQWDMVQFCIDADHKSPKWPDEYWPKETVPKDDEAWNNSLKQIHDDLQEFITILKRKISTKN